MTLFVPGYFLRSLSTFRSRSAHSSPTFASIRPSNSSAETVLILARRRSRNPAAGARSGGAGSHSRFGGGQDPSGYLFIKCSLWAARLGIAPATKKHAKAWCALLRKGRVTVDWSMNDSFVIDWCEADGPKVAPPTKYNFGSRLIARRLSRRGAQFEPRFLETGYCYKMTLPLAALAR
jgi:hypothetical protein